MKKSALIRTFSAALALASLASCGNDPTTTANRGYIKSIISQLGSGGQGNQVTPAQIAQAKATLPGPLLLVTVESRNSSTVVTQIEENGPVKTFATGTRQVINLENGALRGTRGLADDLMSTELGALPAALAGHPDQSGARSFTFLTAASEEYTLKMHCQYSGRAVVSETCRQSDGSTAFTNTYTRAHDGQITASRQWLSPKLGYVRIEKIK